ncbi:MAG: hypothetical protein M1371_07050 [Actinobacteria bacterium]|nr:hypothetical protein [Actinomycetota bacterium]
MKYKNKSNKFEEFLEEILKEISDPVHQRIIQAYIGENPVDSMESELRKILNEVIQGED